MARVSVHPKLVELHNIMHKAGYKRDPKYQNHYKEHKVPHSPLKTISESYSFNIKSNHAPASVAKHIADHFEPHPESSKIYIAKGDHSAGLHITKSDGGGHTIHLRGCRLVHTGK